MKKQAAGVVFYSLQTDRLLLNYRSGEVSNPQKWAFFGGKINEDETVIEGLNREIREEMGKVPLYILALPLDVFVSIDQKFEYYSYIVFVEKEFVPEINQESSGWGWFDLKNLPRGLHSGAYAVLCSNNFEQIIQDIIKNNNLKN